MRHISFSRILLVIAFVIGAGAAASGPALAADEVTAVVNVSQLNLRAGPGFAYIAIKVLDQGQNLSVLGRSADSVWLEVRLPDGSGGWGYANFVRTNARIADVLVTEAAGGPTDQPSGSQRYSLSMTITDNQATVDVQRFPANAEIVVTLGLPGGSASLIVASGPTDAGGSTQFTFAMPRQWPDGKHVSQNTLVLVASIVDGTFSRTASIQYYP